MNPCNWGLFDAPLKMEGISVAMIQKGIQKQHDFWKLATKLAIFHKWVKIIWQNPTDSRFRHSFFWGGLWQSPKNDGNRVSKKQKHKFSRCHFQTWQISRKILPLPTSPTNRIFQPRKKVVSPSPQLLGPSDRYIHILVALKGLEVDKLQ